MLNIVLHQPEIPANTGNIGRTCVATGTVLHLIEPLGFSLSEKQLKRAGMDYWNLLDVRRYINFADFLGKNPTLVSGGPDAPKLWMATTKAHQVYSDVKSDRTIILCSARRVPESRRKSLWSMKRAVSAFRWDRISVP